MYIPTKSSAIGSYLRKCRRRQNMSQSALAKKMGYGSGQYISNIERGECEASFEVLRFYIVYCKADRLKLRIAYQKRFKKVLDKAFMIRYK